MLGEGKTNREKGDEGEEIAADFLTKLGYDIIEKKWRHQKYEVDIIARNGSSIVFVEVKTRYSNVYGEPWEAVNKAKRKRLTSSADHFIRTFDIELEPQFDIVSIVITNDKRTILHIPKAFWPVA